MSFERIPDEIRERLENAPSGVTTTQLVAETGVSYPTAMKYRRVGEEKRAEAARSVLKERVADETPNALAALSECVKISHERMKATKHPDYIRECRASAKCLLDYLGLAPEPDEFDEISNETLLDEVRRRLGPGAL